MKIEKTTDYKIFKYHKENREVKLSHVENLVESIKHKNLLQYLPLLVDKDMKIIDGQHRLEAAKLLKVPVYYIVLEDSEVDDIWLLNSNLKKWSGEDFLNFYVKRGKSDYIVMKDFMRKYNFSTYLALHILLYSSSGARDIYEIFKEGNLKIADIGFSRRAAEHVIELKPYCEDNCWKGRDFVRAVCYLLKNHPEELMQTLIKKLRTPNKGDVITRAANLKQYIRQFEYTLNKGKTKAESFIRLF